MQKIKFKHYIEYVILVIAGALVRWLPLWIKMPLGALIGEFLYIIAGRHRRIAIVNVSRSFPEKSARECRRIARKSVRNLGRTFAEFLHLPHITQRYVERNIEYVGFEYAEAAIKAGNGIIGITSHLDNWELLGTVMQKRGFDLRGIYHPMKNPLSDRYINNIRRATGMTLISMKASPKEFLRAFADNAILGLIADQDAGKSGVFVDFLGRQASAWKGPALFALKTKAVPLVFLFERVKGRKHRMIVVPFGDLPHTGDTENDVRIITQRWNDIIADGVRKNPEQYYWVHRRWHTRPPEETPQ